MKYSLNGATTMNADLVTDIRAAKAAGFDCLEIWAAKLRSYLQLHTTTELKAVFDPRGGAWVQGNYVPSLLAAIGGVVERHLGVDQGELFVARH